MSGGNNTPFTSWPIDDLIAFGVSLGSPLLIGVPVMLAFLVWTLAVVIVLGLPLFLIETIVGTNLLLNIGAAVVFLVWMSGFCLGCTLFYLGYLDMYPTTLPADRASLAWWVGLPTLVFGYIGYRTIEANEPGGTLDFLLFFGVVFFASYLIASRGRVIVNTVRSTTGATATSVVSGFVLAGGTLEVMTYLIGYPVADILAENGDTLVGMVLVYLPVVLGTIFVAGVFERAGIPFGTRIDEMSSGSAVELNVVLFDIETGEGLATALVTAFIVVPAVVLVVEVTWHGGRHVLTRISTSATSSRSLYRPHWISSPSRLPQPGRVRTSLSTLETFVYDILAAVILIKRDGLYVGGYLLGSILITGAGILLVGIGVIVLHAVSFLLFFSDFAGSVIEWLMTVVLVVGFSVTPLTIAIMSHELISPPDGELLPLPSSWVFPMAIPIIGIGIVSVGNDYLIPPWMGLAEKLIAGTLAAVILYRGSLYAIISDSNISSYMLNADQQLVNDRFVDGRRAGPIVFAIGTAWLTLPIVLSTIETAYYPFGRELVSVLSVVPYFPPSTMTLIGVPIALGFGMTAVYGLRNFILVGLGYRKQIRTAVSNTIQRVITMGCISASLTLQILRKLTRLFELVVLLRP